MALTIASPATTGTGVAAQHAKNSVEAWNQGFMLAEYEHDIMARFEGGSSDMAIPSKTLPVAAGQTINFRLQEGLYGPGVIGETEVAPPEGLTFGGFALGVDYIRHSANISKRTNLVLGIGQEIQNGIPEMLGTWLARRKCAHLMTLLTRTGGTGENITYANGKGSRDALTAADTLTWSDVTKVGQIMRSRGAMPAKVMTDRRSGRPIHGFHFLGLGEGWTALKNSTTYRDNVQQAGGNNLENPLFQGNLVPIDGHTLIEWNPPDHAGAGSLGSALNPIARLGVAITTGTSAVDITGGGNATNGALTTPQYFEHFSNSAWSFTTASAINADTSTLRYVIIYNVSGADAGKWGMYSYKVNNGNKLTMFKRLGASDSGDRLDDIGSVHYDSNVNTDAHPAGSLVFEVNAKGIPIGRTIVLGRKAAFRGYSSLERIVRTKETHEGGFIEQFYIRSIQGQTLCPQLDGRYRNHQIIEHAITLPGLANLPTGA